MGDNSTFIRGVVRDSLKQATLTAYMSYLGRSNLGTVGLGFSRRFDNVDPALVWAVTGYFREYVQTLPSDQQGDLLENDSIVGSMLMDAAQSPRIYYNVVASTVTHQFLSFESFSTLVGNLVDRNSDSNDNARFLLESIDVGVRYRVNDHLIDLIAMYDRVLQRNDIGRHVIYSPLIMNRFIPVLFSGPISYFAHSRSAVEGVALAFDRLKPKIKDAIAGETDRQKFLDTAFMHSLRLGLLYLHAHHLFDEGRTPLTYKSN